MSPKQESANFLDFVFEKNPAISYETTDKGRVCLLCRHTGCFALIAQKLFKRPEITKIELDEIGSFVWENIDGKASVYKLGKCLKDNFGDLTEPLYERLYEFMKQLWHFGFIQIV